MLTVAQQTLIEPLEVIHWNMSYAENSELIKYSGSLMSIDNAATLTFNKQDKILLVPPYVILVNSWSLSL